MEKLRSALFWMGLVLYLASFFVPGEPTTGRLPNVGATLFLLSAYCTVISCGGILSFFQTLSSQSDAYPLGEIITGIYLGPLSLVNIPIIMTIIARFRNVKIPRRRWVAALLFGLIYASFVPFLPGLMFGDVAMPYFAWISSAMFFSLYVLVSEYQLAHRHVTKRVLVVAMIAISLGIALLISYSVEFRITNSDVSGHEPMQYDLFRPQIER